MILLSISPEYQAYNAHLNYIKCLASLMNGTTLQYKNSLQKACLPDIDQKKNLIAFTKKSLSDEKKIVDFDIDYSCASTSRIPVKSYYLIFNVLLTLGYVTKNTKRYFQTGTYKMY